MLENQSINRNFQDTRTNNPQTTYGIFRSLDLSQGQHFFDGRRDH